MTMTMTVSNEEDCAIAQRDECDSMAAIFADDFSLLDSDNGNSSNINISYSVRLRPDLSHLVDDSECDHCDIADDLALAITYPHAYPDTPPIFHFTNNRPLHPVQERALLNVVDTAAHAELGMPCVYSCIQAANEFLANGGLDQAGISLLSDDCLAHILSYLATTKEEIEDVICVALPIFKEASKSNAVWEQLCRRRWSEKWNFRKRWEVALNDFQSTIIDHYWRQAYHNAEKDSTRSTLTRSELSAMKFDIRQWFSFSAFRNQPDNMRDILPTGLKTPLARDVVFVESGSILSPSGNTRHSKIHLGSCSWKANDAANENNAAISGLRLGTTGRAFTQSFALRRLDDWGWEMRGSDYIMRAVDDDWDSDKLFEDLTSKIMVQDRLDWVVPRRGPYPYNYREVPDNDDCQMMLDW